MPGLFPDDSKSGGETTAAPKIWSDKAAFNAAFAKFEADSKAAQASVKDLDSFKAAFGADGQTLRLLPRDLSYRELISTGRKAISWAAVHWTCRPCTFRNRFDHLTFPQV